MITISYCGRSYTHNHGMCFDTNKCDAGFDCDLLLFASTPAEFRVDGEMKQYPAESWPYFLPVIASTTARFQKHTPMIGFDLNQTKSSYPHFRSRMFRSSHRIRTISII